jgi:hypothetical protein
MSNWLFGKIFQHFLQIWSVFCVAIWQLGCPASVGVSNCVFWGKKKIFFQFKMTKKKKKKKKN